MIRNFRRIDFYKSVIIFIVIFITDNIIIIIITIIFIIIIIVIIIFVSLKIPKYSKSKQVFRDHDLLDLIT